MKIVYALIYRQEKGAGPEFEQRIPRLMAWLRDLKTQGKLRGCGGWEDAPGGLTLVEAANREEAERIAAADPMAEIGRHEIFEWGVFYGDLAVPRSW